MSYEYEHSVTYNFKRYKENKHIIFSDKIKLQLDKYYKGINDTATDLTDRDGKVDKDKRKRLVHNLAKKYALIRENYIKPEVILKYKYKEVAYTQEEIDFIFACSFLLLEKYNLTQEQLAKIFGVYKNKFSKFGIFPVRSFDAYTRLESISNRRSLIPSNIESEGISIAKCINREVQAVYGCSAFVGVTNMLDVFANISSTDTKAYVITRPSSVFESNNAEGILAYPRYLFATANNLENVTDGKSYIAGKLKKQIKSLLKMTDSSIYRYSQVCQGLLIEGDTGNYVSTGNGRGFKNDLEMYRKQITLLADIEEGSYSDEYFEDESQFDEYGLAGGLEDGIDIYDEEELSEYLVASIKDLKEELLKRISFADKEFDTSEFQDYKMAMLSMLHEKSEVYSNHSSGVCKLLNRDEKIRLASIFWVIKVLGMEETSEAKRDEVLKYLKTKSLLGYLDSLNKEVKKGGDTHLYYEYDDFDISKLVDKLQIQDNPCPVLLYIDGDAYGVSDLVIKNLKLRNKLIIVLRDRLNTVKKNGFKIINKKYSLYLWESQ